MNKPFFSIITASYNSEKTIERTIKSILSLDFEDFEYIIIDGNSTDKTLNIIESYVKEFLNKGIVFKWISEPDKGIYDAWNKGVKLCNAEWISFLGSDDIYLQNALSLYYKNIQSNSAINFISSKVELIDSNEKKIKILGSRYRKSTFITYMNIAHVGSFHKKSFLNNGEFSLNYRSSSDYDFFLKNLDTINPFFFNEITAKMQDGGVSNNIAMSLRETLHVKLNNRRRFFLFCYFDFYYAHFKHILYLCFRNFL